MNGLARCLKAEGKIDEAVKLWEKMQADNPGVNAATVGLAQTYLEQKDYANALKYWHVLAKSQPDNEDYQKKLKRAEEGAATSME